MEVIFLVIDSLWFGKKRKCECLEFVCRGATCDDFAAVESSLSLNRNVLQTGLMDGWMDGFQTKNGGLDPSAIHRNE